MSEGAFKIILLIINIIIGFRFYTINKEYYEDRLGIALATFLALSWMGNFLYIFFSDKEFSMEAIAMSPFTGPISFYSFGIYFYTIFNALLFFSSSLKRKNTKPTDSKIREFIIKYIHPNDHDLLKKEDIIWMAGLTHNDIEKIITQDDIFRMGRYSMLLKSGLDDITSIKTVLHDYPLFYVSSDARSRMPSPENGLILFSDDDLRLPFCVKNRFNHFIFLASHDVNIKNIFQSYLNKSSSANSAVRRMIRDNIF